MTLIFPIGGTGERFRRVGITTPKPFIKLYGKPLLAHAMGSYLMDHNSIFFIREELVGELKALLKTYPNITYQIYAIDKPTKGPLETILHGSTQLNGQIGEVLFADCDSMILYSEIESAIDLFRLCGASGGVTIRTTDELDCSYCVLDKDHWVLETKEKDNRFGDVVSRHSTTGPYWFRSFDQFMDCALEAVKDGQYHISPVYNYLIRHGGRVKAFPVSTFTHFGTPEALEKYGWKG